MTLEEDPNLQMFLRVLMMILSSGDFALRDASGSANILRSTVLTSSIACLVPSSTLVYAVLT